MFFELLCKDLVSSVIFADEQRTRCIHIDPVDDPGAQNAVDPGKVFPTMEHHSIHQSMAVVPGCRVYHHPLRLIDDKDIIVLIEDVKRDILRKDVKWFRLRDLHLNRVTFRKFIVCFYCFHRPLYNKKVSEIQTRYMQSQHSSPPH